MSVFYKKTRITTYSVVLVLAMLFGNHVCAAVKIGENERIDNDVITMEKTGKTIEDRVEVKIGYNDNDFKTIYLSQLVTSSLFNNGTKLNMTSKNSVITVNSINNDNFIKNYGITNVDAYYILYIGSTVFHKTPGFTQLFYNTDNSTLTIGGIFTVIEDSTIIEYYPTMKLGTATLVKKLFYNKNGTINIGTDKTDVLSINGSRIEKKGWSFTGHLNILFDNENGFMNFKGKTIAIEDSIINSDRIAGLFYNIGNGIMTIGTNKTKKLNISTNKVEIKSKKWFLTGEICLLKNNHILNLNANSIAITNNIVTPISVKLNDNKDKYSVIFKNQGTLNINLYGNNPSFTLAGNEMSEYSNGKGVIGILNSSTVNFTNYSNTEAKVILGHNIRDYKIIPLLSPSKTPKEILMVHSI